MDADDLRAVLRAAPDLYLLLAPDLTVLDASDAYLRATMTRREEILGRPLFEVFPEDPRELGAGGLALGRASIERVLAEKLPDAPPALRYPIRRREAEGGGFEERFWRTLNTPLLGDDGAVRYVLHRTEDVTESVRLERETLERSRALLEASALTQRYRMLLDSAPDATVIVDDRGRIQLVNVQTEALFGYGRDELLGQELTLLLPERFRAAHAEHLRRYFARPGTRPMGSGLQLFGRRKDGVELPIEVSLSPLHDEQGGTVSASIRDVSERKRLEAAASLTAQRLSSAVESVQDAIALFDAQDRLILCNSVFQRHAHADAPGALVGKGYAEVLDAWIGDVHFADEAARAAFREDRLARRLREPSSSFDVRMRDGRSLRVTDRRTAEGGTVKTIWDLTDDERRESALREARAAAESASHAKSEFLSSMSHELRTPLNAVLGFAQLLQRDRREPLSPRHKDRVAQILRGGEHLLHLIDDVLDLSRIEAGAVTLSTEPVGVAEVLEEVRITLGPIAARQGISLDVDAFGDHAPTVLADRTRVAQVLLNLGSNAIKYNRPGGAVRFAVSSAVAGRVRVSVRDTGLGIPLDKQDKLFQPFQRAGQESGPIEGTGIGLVITRRLARLMGGDVGFESTPGQGSEFWLELPAHEPLARAEPASASSRAPAPAAGGAPRAVLYVEDNPANVVFMRDMLDSVESVTLHAVPTAELGVEYARAWLPDLIILDVNLPGMSGLDALGLLRASPETRAIPVIALTAAASERDRQRGHAAGFDRYLTKPVKVDEFLDAMQSLLSACPQRR